MSFEISCLRKRTEGDVNTRCLPLVAVSAHPVFIVSKTPRHMRTANVDNFFQIVC